MRKSNAVEQDDYEPVDTAILSEGGSDLDRDALDCDSEKYWSISRRLRGR